LDKDFAYRVEVTTKLKGAYQDLPEEEINIMGRKITNKILYNQSYGDEDENINKVIGWLGLSPVTPPQRQITPEKITTT